MATRLTDAEVEEALRSLPGWAREGDAIVKTYEADRSRRHRVRREIADRAEAAEPPSRPRHPLPKLRVALSTHDAGGLTRLDVDLAGQIDDAEG